MIRDEYLSLARTDLASAGSRHGNGYDNELVKGNEWLEFVFFNRGVELDENTVRCPVTADAIRQVRLAPCVGI